MSLAIYTSFFSSIVLQVLGTLYNCCIAMFLRDLNSGRPTLIVYELFEFEFLNLFFIFFLLLTSEVINLVMLLISE